MMDKLLSPTLPPASPAPAYTTLPYSDVAYDFAPLYNGRHGELELETSDGKRFLVHKKIMEQETVFYHIYYGFVPNWRANQRPPQPATSALNSLLCLPKLFQRDVAPPVPPKDPAPGYDNLPPAPITAPTPTDTPFHWLVPEASAVLHAFLSLIYPPGVFTSSPAGPLTSVNMTALVLRAALGYQSAKAVSLARDTLGSFVSSHPVETFACASYFRFNDTARIASRESLRVPEADWPDSAKHLMGRKAVVKLKELHATRIAGLNAILDKPLPEHCARSSMLKTAWDAKIAELKADLTPAGDLAELCSIDVRGGHCGDCLYMMGQHIQMCLQDVTRLTEAVE